MWSRSSRCCCRGLGFGRRIIASPEQAGRNSRPTLLPSTSSRLQQQQRHVQRRPFFSWFYRAKEAFRNTARGDDFINPKKILERKYIYYALLTQRLRSLRLNDDNSRNTKEEEEYDDDDRLYEKALKELEAMDLDEQPNVDLRKQVQTSLRPQVMAIFEAFQRVDERLGIPFLPINDSSDAAVDPLVDLDLSQSEFKDILLQESEQTRCRIDSTKDADSICFLRTKLEAIDTLLAFHRWSEPHSESEPSGTMLDAFGMDMTDRKETTVHLIRQYQTVNLCRSVLIREELGYSVLSLRSCIPGGGRGLFIDGSALAGSVAAFQPGDIWPKEHLVTNAPDVMEHFDGEDDCHISLRFDDYVVDARESPVTVLTREGCMNPWALGNMANHPAPEKMPNCQSNMLNYTADMKLGDRAKYIPNTYAREPTWKSRFFDMDDIIIHGLCLIARRDVTDEELVYDYRLQSEDTPDWYNIVKYGDGLEDEQVVFFRDDWRNKQR